MDESLVIFHTIRNKTIDMKGTKMVHIKTTGDKKISFNHTIFLLNGWYKI